MYITKHYNYIGIRTLSRKN